MPLCCASHCTAIALPMQVLAHCASARSSKNNFPLHLPMSLLHSRKCNSSKSLFLSSNTFFSKSFLNVFLQEQSTYCKMSLRALFTFDVTLSMLVGLEKGCNANWTCPLTNIFFHRKFRPNFSFFWPKNTLMAPQPLVQRQMDIS